MPRGSSDAERRQHGRPHVVRGGEVVAGPARRPCPPGWRIANGTWRQLLVHLRVALAHPAVLAEQHAVVAHQHHERVLGQPQVLEPVEEAARARRRPSSPRPRTAARIRRSSRWVRSTSLAPSRPAWRTAGSAPRRAGSASPYMSISRRGRVPRLVRVERVDHERERLARARPLDPVHAVPEDLRGDVAPPRPGRGGFQREVRLHARLGARCRAATAAGSGRARAVTRGAVRACAPRHLAVDQLDPVELLPEALVHRQQDVRVVGHVPGGPALPCRSVTVHISPSIPTGSQPGCGGRPGHGCQPRNG